MRIISTFFKWIFSWEKAYLLVAIIIGHFVFFSVLGLRSIGALQTLELQIYDFMLWTRSISLPTDPRIVMILANDGDQRQWGWPLADKELVKAFQAILECQPRAIGLDLYRDLPVPMEGSEGFAEFSDILKNNKNIFGIMKFPDSKGGGVQAPPALKGTARVGFNDIPPDSGGIVRRGLLYMADSQNNVLPLFGLQIVLHYLKPMGIFPKQHPTDPRGMLLGKAELIPIDEDFGGYIKQDTGGFQFMLAYPGAPVGFTIFTFTQILNGEFNPEVLKDKIVLIGVKADATPDFVYTPFSMWLRDEQRIPGVTLHAYTISQLLRLSLGEIKPITSWDETQERMWIWIWCILSPLICLWARSLWRFSLSMVSGILILCAIGQFSFASDVWILVAAPGIGWIFSFLLMLAYLSNQDKTQRAVLMHIFSKHVSKNVAQVIWQEREQYLNAGRLRPQRITATVLFSDLQGFTTVSENMEPQALMDWLNQYMESMVNVVETHNGQVNKFIGDAIMALFGVPIPSTTPEQIASDAQNAINCALAMRQEIEKLRHTWQSQGLPLIRMRVGIFTGAVVAGSLGGIERQEYTVLGDTVNIASRLESFDKTIDADQPCRILIGESTLKYLDEGFKTDFVGKVYLKGKQSEVGIYRVIGFNKAP